MGIFDRITKPDNEGKVMPLTESNETNIDKTNRVMGSILSLNKERGFGFIQSKALPFVRIYFHWTFLVPGTKKFTELQRGMKVEFTLTRGNDSKGIETDRAVNIVVLE